MQTGANAALLILNECRPAAGRKLKEVMDGRAQERMRIGIPRALGHYLYPDLWETFLKEIGMQVVLSSPSTRKTVESAGLRSETEHCLPFKLFDAHLAELVGKVDMVFVPRILSTRRGHIACPKLGVMPDSARAQYPQGIRVLTVDVNERLVPLADTLAQLGRTLKADEATIKVAGERAITALHRAHHTNRPGGTPRPAEPLRFLVLGHPYNLHDPFLSGLILRKLELLGVGVETVSFTNQDVEPEPIKWDMCSVMYDQLRRLEPCEWAGVIQLSSFNCGCDSIVSVLFREILEEKHIPLMTLVLDEHAGQAGVDTRLEAFVDSIKEQHAIASH